ncbi:hypothetical protein AKJ16_DCAP01337 [Drosera capensis]
MWSLDIFPSPLPPANNQWTVDLVLKPTEDDIQLWAVLVGKLILIPRVRNTANKSFSFKFALRNLLVRI